jgi:hypothetical protein
MTVAAILFCVVLLGLFATGLYLGNRER